MTAVRGRGQTGVDRTLRDVGISLCLYPSGSSTSVVHSGPVEWKYVPVLVPIALPRGPPSVPLVSPPPRASDLTSSLTDNGRRTIIRLVYRVTEPRDRRRIWSVPRGGEDQVGTGRRGRPTLGPCGGGGARGPGWVGDVTSPLPLPSG